MRRRQPVQKLDAPQFYELGPIHITRIDRESKWKMGEWASKWKEETGLSDAELADRVESSKATIRQYRNVWDKFSTGYLGTRLSWSHYRAALDWDDANECFDWANEHGANCKEMIAWRKAKNGEPLKQEEPKDDDDDANTESEPLAGAHIDKKSDSDSPLVTQKKTTD